MNSLVECRAQEIPQSVALKEGVCFGGLEDTKGIHQAAIHEKFPENIFWKIQADGNIGEGGVASESLRWKPLPPLLQSSEERFKALLSTKIVFPAKKLNEIPMIKRELVLRALNALKENWNIYVKDRRFPFVYDEKQNTLAITLSFDYWELMQFVEDLPFVRRIEFYGGAFPYVLGEEYFDKIAVSIAGEEHTQRCSRPQKWLDRPDDMDFAVECAGDSFDPVFAEECFVKFLADKIPHSDEEKNSLQVILRETAFKNLFVTRSDFRNPHLLVSFQNSEGIDIDITLAKTIVRTPFTLCHGLRAPISIRKWSGSPIYPVSEEVNPWQCIFDKMGGIYRIFERIDREPFERKIGWLVQVLSKGGTLILNEKKDWLLEGLSASSAVRELFRLHRKWGSDDQLAFMILMDALNAAGFLLEKGLHVEADRFFQSVIVEMNRESCNLVKIQGFAGKILLRLCGEGQAVGHALMALRDVLFYLLPSFRSFTNASILYGEKANESADQVALEIGYRDKKRILHFPRILGQPFSYLFSRDADSWGSLLLESVRPSLEEAIDVPVQALSNIDWKRDSSGSEETVPRWMSAFRAETALFCEGRLVWDEFLRMKPLSFLLQNTSVEEKVLFLRRINGRLKSLSTRGFCHTEEGVLKEEGKGEIVKRFFRDLSFLCKEAIVQMKRDLIEEIGQELKVADKNKVLLELVEDLFGKDPQIAASVLDQALKDGFPLDFAAPALTRIIDDKGVLQATGHPLKAAVYVASTLLNDSGIIRGREVRALFFKAIGYVSENEPLAYSGIILKAFEREYELPLDGCTMSSLIAEMKREEPDRDQRLACLFKSRGTVFCKPLALADPSAFVKFLKRLYKAGSKEEAYALFKLADGAPLNGSKGAFKEMVLSGIGKEIQEGKANNLRSYLEQKPFSSLDSSYRREAALRLMRSSINSNDGRGAAEAIDSLLLEDALDDELSTMLMDAIEELVLKSKGSSGDSSKVEGLIKKLLLHPRLMVHLPKRRVFSLYLLAASRLMQEEKSGYAELLIELIPRAFGLALDNNLDDLLTDGPFGICREALLYFQRRSRQKTPITQALLKYFQETLPAHLFGKKQYGLLFSYAAEIASCDRVNFHHLVNHCLEAFSHLEEGMVHAAAQTLLRLFSPTIKLYLGKMGVKRLVSTEECREDPSKLLLVCRSAFSSFDGEDLAPFRREIIQAMQHAGLICLKEIKTILLSFGFSHSDEGVVELIIKLIESADKRAIIQNLELLEPFLKDSLRLRAFFRDELAITTEELIDLSVEEGAGEAFTLLLELRESASFSFWLKGIAFLDKPSQRCAKSFISFFSSSLSTVDEKNKEAFFLLMEKIAGAAKAAKASLSEEFMEGAQLAAAHFSGSRRERVLFLAIEAFLQSAIRSKNPLQMDLFWQFRERLALGHDSLLQIDSQAVLQSTPPLNETSVDPTLNACLRLYANKRTSRSHALKSLSLLESLDSSSARWADSGYALSRQLLNGEEIKGEEKMRLMKAAIPFFLRFNDALSLYTAISSFFEAIGMGDIHPRKAMNDIPLAACISPMPDDFAEAILSNKAAPIAVSLPVLKEAAVIFLKRGIERALTSESREEALMAIGRHSKLFFLLDVGSSLERSVTNDVVKLYTLLIRLNGSSKECFTLLGNMARECVLHLKLHQFADVAIDVLLWSSDMPFCRAKTKEVVKNHVGQRAMIKWKERFFEIAQEMIGSFLAQPSCGEEINQVYLTCASLMIGALMKNSHTNAEILFGLYEKMLFSKMSLGSYSLFVSNLRNCKRILSSLMEQGCLAKNPELFYRVILFIELKDWLNNPFTLSKKRYLVDSVFNYLLGADQFYTVHQAISILQTSSLLLFDKDDEKRRAVFLKTMQAVMRYPRAKVMIVSFDEESLKDSKKEDVDPGKLQVFFTKAELEALKSRGGRPREELLLKTFLECLVNDERQIIAVNEENKAESACIFIETIVERVVSFALAPEEDDVKAEDFLKILFRFLKRCHQCNLFQTENSFLDKIELFFSPSLFEPIARSSSLTRIFGELMRSALSGKETSERRSQLYIKMVKILLSSDEREIALRGKLLLEWGLKENVFKPQINIIQSDRELNMLLYKLI